MTRNASFSPFGVTSKSGSFVPYPIIILRLICVFFIVGLISLAYIFALVSFGRKDAKHILKAL